MSAMEYGKITEESLSAFEDRVGVQLRIRNIFNEEVTNDSIRKFANGIGDTNPLWQDKDYALKSPYGRVVAPPSWLASVFPTWVLQGLPGVHAIHVSTDWTFYKPVFLGDRIRPESYFIGFNVGNSPFGGKTVVEHQEAKYFNQRGELVAIATPKGYRMERESMITLNKQGDIVLPHPWTEEELDKIEQDILNEKERGHEPLYWEDVQVGDLLPVITKGPIGITDMIAYCIGASPVEIKAHGAALKSYQKHPDWCFRDPLTRALEPIYSVHYNQYAAESCGLPYPYDVGVQRHCWLMQVLTNWMGDYGWLKNCSAKYSGFVYLSDVVRITGKITKKYRSEQGELLVVVKTTAVNQRGENVMPGKSIVELPSKKNKNSVINKLCL